jgi:DNA-binding XRE family transcriptional regulator
MLGRNLKRLREQRCWSQAHLAEAARVNVRTIQRLEAGEPCSPETLLSLAAALDIEIAELRRPDAGAIERGAPPAGNRSSGVATIVAALACAPAVLFVAVNLLKYGAGVPQPFDLLAGAGSRVMSFAAFDSLSPFLFIGGLMLAIALCVRNVARPRAHYADGVLTLSGVDLRLRASDLILLILSAAGAGALALYALGEAIGHSH